MADDRLQCCLCRGTKTIEGGNRERSWRKASLGTPADISAAGFMYTFTAGPNTSQAQVYVETVAPVVRTMLDGYNCSVLAYGQTGSGKTFTMEGGLSSHNSDTDSSALCIHSIAERASVKAETLGMIPRAVHTIFREGDAFGRRQYWVYVSYMEIYNERLYDLLAPDDDQDRTFDSHQQHQQLKVRRSSPSPRGARSLSPSSHRQRSPSPRPAGPPPLNRGSSSPRSTSPNNRRATSIVSTEAAARAVESTGSVSANNADHPHNCVEVVTPRFISPRITSLKPQEDRGQIHGGVHAEEQHKNENPRTLAPRSPKSGVLSSRFSTNASGGRSFRDGDGRGNKGSIDKGLTIEENSELGVIVKGLTQVEVKSPEEIFAIIARSNENRRTAEVA